ARDHQLGLPRLNLRAAPAVLTALGAFLRRSQTPSPARISSVTLRDFAWGCVSARCETCDQGESARRRAATRVGHRGRASLCLAHMRQHAVSGKTTTMTSDINATLSSG